MFFCFCTVTSECVDFPAPDQDPAIITQGDLELSSNHHGPGSPLNQLTGARFTCELAGSGRDFLEHYGLEAPPPELRILSAGDSSYSGSGWSRVPHVWLRDEIRLSGEPRVRQGKREGDRRFRGRGRDRGRWHLGCPRKALVGRPIASCRSRFTLKPSFPPNRVSGCT